ncbi:spindle and kinetochore-associated protein 3 [Lampris incognitus]|uniref:spindle and kinetochore-associated protein 3 n=1 Tax=Lampris incognitus TaxID=2546036 RepID=UPI0024B53EFA|nr:spindle and kinetochore-associated protein 3 [Lampris incognitus]
MDPTSSFFTKLRKLGTTLETETARFQHVYQNRDCGDENTERAMQTYHKLHLEVMDVKDQVRAQLAQQRVEEEEVSRFLKACEVMKQRCAEDVERLKRHCEKYGYQAPQKGHSPTKVICQEVEAADKAVVEEDDSGETKGEVETEQEVKETSLKMELRARTVDPLRTPQLSDFGLSEMQLRRVLSSSRFTAEVPPMPEMNLSPPSLYMSIQQPMPVTPKLMLRMDEDERQTPQMRDFGISEHTMSLNNDFTMALYQMNNEKAKRTPDSLPTRPVNSVIDNLSTKADSMESPETPIFCTPGIKISKSHDCTSKPPPVEGGNLGSPDCPINLQTTPEVPVFQTPYVNRLVSARKVQTSEPADDENPVPEISTPTNRTATKCTWEYNVPEVSIGDGDDGLTPEMPSLESNLGSNLKNSTKGRTKECKIRAGEPTYHSLDRDGPTQEVSLVTEPSTPEMPDLSSVTQDICKLLAQTQLKKPAAIVQPHTWPSGKENRVLSLPIVSESEFQSLPGYLKQMSLSSLNQAIQKINIAAAEKCYGEATDGWKMADLKQLTGMGTKAPIYFLCLTELKRLEHIKGAGNTSVYKLTPHN